MINALNEGILGVNEGLPTGIRKLDNAIYSIQRGAIYGIASAPKVGKSTFVDSCFIYNPYLYMLDNADVNIDFIYFSLEMDKMVLRYKAVAYFFNKDFGIGSVILPEGKTHKGHSVISMQSGYLLGRMKYDDGTRIIISKEHEKLVHRIIETRINPMYGEYDKNGKKIKNGKITVIEDRNNSNPTGIYKYLLNYAEENGKFIYETWYETKKGTNEKIAHKRISGYTPNNPKKYVIIVLDHLRKLKMEKSGYKMMTMKETMDKMTEYQVWLRNICKFTFVDIVHLNRNISDPARIKASTDYRTKDSVLHPNNSDLKDSGNLSEDADYLITLFDAGDKRYNISMHFGVEISDIPNYRSIHLVESRHTECPIHIQTQMFAGISDFKELYNSSITYRTKIQFRNFVSRKIQLILRTA